MCPVPAAPAFALSGVDLLASASTSGPPPPSKLTFSSDQLSTINSQLSYSSPQEILAWAIDHLPGLYQTTAFGLTGCAALDMISRISRDRNKPHLVDVIFFDTLYHFHETLELAESSTSRVDARLHRYTPHGVSSSVEFESIQGQRLWETDEDTYDFLVKVEPARRAYAELGVQAVITGRRRSQGGDRSSIPIVEVDETGLIKVNPLAQWTYADTWDYIQRNGVPYNKLVDQGYKSIGDWHSTKRPLGVEPTGGVAGMAADADERSGRWEGMNKTECGLHKDYFKMKRAFEKKQRERELATRDELRDLEASSSTIAETPCTGVE